MKILALDTSAKVSSVSIVTEEKVLAEFTVQLNLTHSQTIMPMCEQLLNCCQISLEEIDAFAVAKGPGSFTGLRIGLSAVKGMAYALKKPCIAVSTLDALSINGKQFDGIICCVMDARCNQVYNALYESRKNSFTKLTEDRALFIEELSQELKQLHQPVLLVGDGALLCYNKLIDQLPDLYLAAENNRYQRASSVGLAALEKAQRGEFISASDLIPQYLRLPQAQRERMKKLEEQK